MSDLVRVVVDDERCIGSGVCEMLETGVFLIDEDTFVAGVVEGATLPGDRAAVVIDRCPASAISIDTSDAPITD